MSFFNLNSLRLKNKDQSSCIWFTDGATTTIYKADNLESTLRNVPYVMMGAVYPEVVSSYERDRAHRIRQECSVLITVQDKLLLANLNLDGRYSGLLDKGQEN